MNFLRRAQNFCDDQGDGDWFRNLYTGFRAYNNVGDSVWKTLSYLYGNKVADELESSISKVV